MNRNYSRLQNTGNSTIPRSWNANGDSTVNMMSTAAPGTATNATTGGTKPAGCTTCQKKRIACLVAGVLIGVVGTLLLSKKAKAD